MCVRCARNVGLPDGLGRARREADLPLREMRPRVGRLPTHSTRAPNAEEYRRRQADRRGRPEASQRSGNRPVRERVGVDAAAARQPGSAGGIQLGPRLGGAPAARGASVASASASSLAPIRASPIRRQLPHARHVQVYPPVIRAKRTRDVAWAASGSERFRQVTNSWRASASPRLSRPVQSHDHARTVERRRSSPRTRPARNGPLSTSSISAE